MAGTSPGNWPTWRVIECNDKTFRRPRFHDNPLRLRVLVVTMLKAGIVGLPNVGKSTLFNAVTRTRKAAAENYPFCTIDPNVGVVTVPDARLEPLAKIAKTTVKYAPGLRPVCVRFRPD